MVDPSERSDPGGAVPTGAGAVWCIVVAGGSGRRFGAPKQFRDLAGERMLDRSVAVAGTVADRVVLVVPTAAVDAEAERFGTGAVVVGGGSSRSESVRAGLAAVPDSASVVLVHDAARPLASSELFARARDAVLAGAVAAVPVVDVVDTIRHVERGVVDRDALRAVQTPQAFDATTLRSAHASALVATDDAGLVEQAGAAVVLVPGERSNLKVTEPADLAVAEALLAAQGGGRLDDMTMRIGNGFDVHRFSDDPQRPLVLGGVHFPGERGLAGHSDADAIAHAITDALLGPAGLGDIGQMFPDTDERWGGADSMDLLAEAVRRIRQAGWRPVNADVSVIAERPKLASVKAQMQELLSAAVGAPVTVAGRRAEGIGGLGRGEGIACLASALIERVAAPAVAPGEAEPADGTENGP